MTIHFLDKVSGIPITSLRINKIQDFFRVQSICRQHNKRLTNNELGNRRNNYGYQYFLLFPQCFHALVSLGVVKTMGFEVEGYSKAGKTYSVLKSVSP